REAVQPISAFCRICDIGLSALPAKWRGAPRSAASRMALSAIATGAMMLELRDAGGSGGNSTSTGATTMPRGHSQSMVFRLTKNEIVTIAIPSGIVLRFSVRRIVPRTDRSEEHTSELQSRGHLVCRLLLEKKKKESTPTQYRELLAT